MLDEVAETVDGGQLVVRRRRQKRGRSGFERALGLHFRMLHLIGAVNIHCGRCSHLSAGDANNQAAKQHPLWGIQEAKGRSQAFLTSLGLEQIFASELPGHNHSITYTFETLKS